MKNKYKRFSTWKNNLYTKTSVIDKNKLREEIDAATVEYLKNNKIKHLPNSPNAKVDSVRIRALGTISDAEEFYYLEEQHEYNLY
mgnify:CR=1 FL=1|tara:strand:+ start:19205 stop:19459 length:255 start_codon:yes stop_codon:yes gene_type:complete